MAGLWHLSDVELLEDLSEEEMQELRAAARSQSYDAGETVFAPSKEPHSVYLLKEGAIRIYRLSDRGGEATFGYVQPGEVFGELPVVTQLGRESYAEATTPSVVWRLPIDLFRRLMGSRPGIGLNVSNQLGRRLKSIESRVEGLMFHDARLRLALILKELADHFGLRRGEEIEIDGDFTQGELATLVGCSRQTLNQCLGELDDEGLVKMQRKRIRLPSPEALAEFIRLERRKNQER